MKVKINRARLCFAQNLFVASKPATASADSKVKFQIEALIEPTGENVKLMKDAINAEAQREWGEKATDTLKQVHAAGKIWCLRDGDLKDRPEYKGKLVVSAKNETRPITLGSGPDGRGAVTQADGMFYSGCYVNAIIDVKAGSKPSKQVYAYLLGVQFAGDGERLAGSAASADDFEPIKGNATPEVAIQGAAGLF